MSISLMTDVWRLPLQATRKMVLLALADNANDEGTDCWPSIGKLVEKCSMSERAVQGHLAALEASGYIKRHERLGRSNKFTLYVDRIRIEIHQKSKLLNTSTAESAPPSTPEVSPPQNLHSYPSNPCSTETTAESAPPHDLHPTPAESAPITTHEPSLSTTTTVSNAIKSCGGDALSSDLHFPICSQEESIAISSLLISCPAEFRQLALDEIEGARQAGVIKTNLVPFARGIVQAISRGTFTVGHGTKIMAQRIRQSNRQEISKAADLRIDPIALDKGKLFISRLGRH